MYVHIRTRSALHQSRAPNSATQRKRKPMELKTLPIGEQSFVKLRTKNRLYVDKTEFIYRMIQDGTCYFLSRPRRFGKSLLLNTIEAYFQGKKELFEGLYIANQEKEWVKHPVFHLDFSAQSYDSEQKLYNKINTFLTKKEAINLFVSVVNVIQTNSLSVADIMERLGLSGDDSFRKRYLNPAMDEGYVTQLYPDKPTTKGQLYLLTPKGIELLKQLNAN